MKICVFGLWHLGSVTAACLADLGFEVTALDTDASTVEQLAAGNPPIFEPGLQDMISNNIQNGRLTFTTNISEAVKDAEAIWITFDTPVDDDDQADVEFVEQQVTKVLNQVQNETMVIISSQVPVGFTQKLEQYMKHCNPNMRFAYSPENLRLGKALQIFKNPDRIVIGVRTIDDRNDFEKVFGKYPQSLNGCRQSRPK